MSIPFFWFPIVLAHSAGNMAPEPAPDPVSEVAPRWAAAVSQRADAGWHLRDLTSSQGSEGIRVSMTMASSRRAERLSIRYDLESQLFHEFSRERVALPSEERRYENELALFEELRIGGPVAIDFGCDDPYLDFGSRSVSLGEDDFVVPLWSTGRRPGAALSTWLAASLEEGELVDIRDERYDDGAEVRAEVIFVVESVEGVEEMRVVLGAHGEPAHLQLQHAPGTREWASHPGSQELRRLASAASIEHLRFSGDAEEDREEAPKLQIELAGDSRVVLGLGDFEVEEGECGC